MKMKIEIKIKGEIKAYASRHIAQNEKISTVVIRFYG